MVEGVDWTGAGHLQVLLDLVVHAPRQLTNLVIGTITSGSKVRIVTRVPSSTFMNVYDCLRIRKNIIIFHRMLQTRIRSELVISDWSDPDQFFFF